MAVDVYELKSPGLGFNIRNLYPKECVIYKIVNKINNKLYIGHTIRFRKRLSEHRSSLLADRHHSCHLQRSFNKYGIDNFVVEIIEKIDKEIALDRETYWIKKLQSYERDKGYNILIDSPIPRQSKHTEETKRKMSESQKGKKLSKEQKLKLREISLDYWKNHASPNRRAIIQYTKDMIKMNEFVSITEAAESLDIGRRNISNNLNGLSKTAGGFIWKFKNEILCQE